MQAIWNSRAACGGGVGPRKRKVGTHWAHQGDETPRQHVGKELRTGGRVQYKHCEWILNGAYQRSVSVNDGKYEMTKKGHVQSTWIGDRRAGATMAGPIECVVARAFWRCVGSQDATVGTAVLRAGTARASERQKKRAHSAQRACSTRTPKRGLSWRPHGGPDGGVETRDVQTRAGRGSAWDAGRNLAVVALAQGGGKARGRKRAGESAVSQMSVNPKARDLGATFEIGPA